VWLFGEAVHGVAIVGTVLIVLAGIAANRLGSTLKD